MNVHVYFEILNKMGGEGGGLAFFSPLFSK